MISYSDKKEVNIKDKNILHVICLGYNVSIEENTPVGLTIFRGIQAIDRQVFSTICAQLVQVKAQCVSLGPVSARLGLFVQGWAH